MSVEEKIKEELMKEIYGNIDRLYDYMDQHFHLAPEHDNLTVKHLNRLKDQLYLIVQQSHLS